jgi:beta-galactosidase
VDIVGKASPVQWSRSLFNGLAQVIVQSTRQAGEFKLTASAKGLKPATDTVKTEPSVPRPSIP